MSARQLALTFLACSLNVGWHSQGEVSEGRAHTEPQEVPRTIEAPRDTGRGGKGRLMSNEELLVGDPVTFNRPS